MEELVTEAIILDSRSSGRKNRRVSLFTKKSGRVETQATSGMKTTSKLSPHLDVLNLSEVRLVNKNMYLITDALTKDRFDILRENKGRFGEALKVVNLLKSITPENLRDEKLWYYLITSLNKSKFNHSHLLQILGYDPRHAECVSCKGESLSHFLPETQDFICKDCIGNIKEEDLFKI